jgi:hypothetical protein
MTYIIPFNAGGESDVSARFEQAEWEKVTGQQVIIEYQPGAGGAQAWSQLNSLPGDGYTIMGINLPHTILQPMLGWTLWCSSTGWPRCEYVVDVPTGSESAQRMGASRRLHRVDGCSQIASDAPRRACCAHVVRRAVVSDSSSAGTASSPTA